MLSNFYQEYSPWLGRESILFGKYSSWLSRLSICFQKYPPWLGRGSILFGEYSRVLSRVSSYLLWVVLKQRSMWPCTYFGNKMTSSEGGQERMRSDGTDTQTFHSHLSQLTSFSQHQKWVRQQVITQNAETELPNSDAEPSKVQEVDLTTSNANGATSMDQPPPPDTRNNKKWGWEHWRNLKWPRAAPGVGRLVLPVSPTRLFAKFRVSHIHCACAFFWSGDTWFRPKRLTGQDEGLEEAERYFDPCNEYFKTKERELIKSCMGSEVLRDAKMPVAILRDSTHQGW